MTDRELLELAAKACGYDTSHHWNAERLKMKPPVAALCIPSHSTAWNPLDDDGQALRLAVKVGIVIWPPISLDDNAVARPASGALDPCCEERGDPYEASRRAIVRCAAEIGKAMP